MMEKCIDAGTIQAFLDGELASQLQEKVACHLAGCDSCALALAEAEEETAFAFSALEQEFNTLVPTQRLWTKINDSIEQNQTKSIWQTAVANFRFLFANPSIAAFASLLIVVGIFAVIWSSKNTSEQKSYTAATTANPAQAIKISEPEQDTPFAPSQRAVITASDTNKKSLPTAKDSSGYNIVKAGFVNSGNANDRKAPQIIRQPPIDTVTPNPVAPEYLPGEDSYIKTIAALEKTVENRKDEVLKPSARFAFEKDLAVVNSAIDKMKGQVKQNPKNEAAKQVLRSSYQNKIDLLNSVAEKNELMASLR